MRPDTRFVVRACSLILLIGGLALLGPTGMAGAQQQPSPSPTPAQEPSASPTPEPSPSPSCRPPVAPACVPSIGPSASPSPTMTTEPTPSTASSAPAPVSTRTATRTATSRPTVQETFERVDVPNVPVGRASFADDPQSTPSTKAAKSSGDGKNVGAWLAVAIVAVILLGAGGGIGLYLTRETR